MAGWDFQFDTGEFRNTAKTHTENIRRSADAGVEVFGQQVANRMQSLAPVRTGRLRDSIQWRDLGPAVGGVEIGADYWDDVEFGTSDTRAQPFARPAWAEAPSIYRRVMARAFGA